MRLGVRAILGARAIQVRILWAGGQGYSGEAGGGGGEGQDCYGGQSYSGEKFEFEGGAWFVYRSTGGIGGRTMVDWNLQVRKFELGSMVVYWSVCVWGGGYIVG